MIVIAGRTAKRRDAHHGLEGAEKRIVLVRSVTPSG